MAEPAPRARRRITPELVARVPGARQRLERLARIVAEIHQELRRRGLLSPAERPQGS